MKIGERIKICRKALNISVDQLAQRLNKNRATIYRYENSDIENIPIDIIEPLAHVLKVSPAYLMGWKDNPSSHTAGHNSYIYYPRSISAGLPIEVEPVTQEDTIDLSDSVMGKWAGDRSLVMMRVNGDSMNKTIPDGSLIAVKKYPLEQLHDGDIVVYSHNNDYSVKKYFQSGQSVIFRPHSSDNSYVDYVVSANDANLMIHGKVVLYIVELD
ncbi:LexA family protein [Amphibacillus sediminis]|uniref:LexA family protein n=1 Tax=Amphibacillus sediminis TaxID=360185 RepID=UPI00082AD78A|nr:S24 family peptidase [Amphibacillus sediminis]